MLLLDIYFFKDFDLKVSFFTGAIDSSNCYNKDWSWCSRWGSISQSCYTAVIFLNPSGRKLPHLQENSWSCRSIQMASLLFCKTTNIHRGNIFTCGNNISLFSLQVATRNRHSKMERKTYLSGVPKSC